MEHSSITKPRVGVGVGVSIGIGVGAETSAVVFFLVVDVDVDVDDDDDSRDRRFKKLGRRSEGIDDACERRELLTAAVAAAAEAQDNVQVEKGSYISGRFGVAPHTTRLFKSRPMDASRTGFLLPSQCVYAASCAANGLPPCKPASHFVIFITKRKACGRMEMLGTVTVTHVGSFNGRPSSLHLRIHAVNTVPK